MISVGDNIIFDPSREEISVAEAVLAVSVARSGRSGQGNYEDDNKKSNNSTNNLKLLALRTIDPPSRLTNPGIPNSENAATIGGPQAGGNSSSGGNTEDSASSTAFTGEEVPGVWKPRKGGVKRSVISRIVKMVLEKGGVGDEVMEGLDGVEVG